MPPGFQFGTFREYFNLYRPACIGANGFCYPESLVESTGDYLKRVLLVLDNEAIGPTVRQELADSGYDVHWARSVDEADAMWQPNVFDVVLLDVRHDGERSRAFINRIRAAAPAQRVHFLHRRGRVA